MSDKKWRTWEVLGLLFVLAAGNLLHFVYDWTGQSPVVGALAAVNESVWEHMKLLTTPWVLWSIAELVAAGRSGLPVTAARAAGLLAGLAAIPMLFYTYQGVLGRDLMWLDIAIFQIAVLLGFWVSWTVLRRRALAAPLWQVAGGAVLAAVWAAFIVWTFAPPELPLFDERFVNYGYNKIEYTEQLRYYGRRNGVRSRSEELLGM